jgi:hypothetical protein
MLGVGSHSFLVVIAGEGLLPGSQKTQLTHHSTRVLELCWQMMDLLLGEH